MVVIRESIRVQNGRRGKVRNKFQNKNKNRLRSQGYKVLAQGVGTLPKVNFGTKSKSNSGSKQSVKQCMRYLDARIPMTIGLPRSVGPYTVIRTTRLIPLGNAQFTMFGTFQEISPYKGASWMPVCGLQSVDGTKPIIDPSNTLLFPVPIAELLSAAEAVPAAMTVQIMNSESLQQGSGIYQMGRVNQQLHMSQDVASTRTWLDLTAQCISFYSPRLLSAGKLALRGVACSSYPLDMSEYSDFAGIGTTVTETPTTLGQYIKPSALAPIVFLNPGSAGDSDKSLPGIQALVTIEWRVRFDPGNPATASHTYHNITPDEVWNGVVKGMSEAGHGVHDIADDIADLGMGVAGLAAAM